MTDRQRAILQAVERTGNQSEVAAYFGISRQRVNQVVKARHKGYGMPVYYKDLGCPDGSYPSCLRCPLVRCKEDDN